MIEDDFRFVWPDFCEVVLEIVWSRPAPHDLLLSGGMHEDDTAYFYSIVSLVDGNWLPFYIGMTHAQSAAIRNGQPDHKERLARLKKENRGHDFSITLGTPKFQRGKPTRVLIGQIEGLLIYSNWHDRMINEKKTQKYSCPKQMYVRNTGWSEHLSPEVAYGVFYRKG